MSSVFLGVRGWVGEYILHSSCFQPGSLYSLKNLQSFYPNLALPVKEESDGLIGGCGRNH